VRWTVRSIGSTRRSLVRPSAVLSVAMLALAGCAPGSAGAVPASPGPTPRTATLHISEPDVQFETYICRVAGRDPCRGVADSTGHGTIASNLAGDGTSEFDLVVDDSDPGPNGDCNTVHETDTFTFTSGTLSVESLHRDCNFGGTRINTLFVITGGTGEFAGATGYGVESDANGIAYDADISYLPQPASS